MKGERHLIYIPSVLKTVQEQMTPEEFASTESVQRYVEDRVRRVSTNIPVSLIFDDENYTDGKVIHINPKWASLMARSNFEALLILLGYGFHEVLHIVHTDFKMVEEYRRNGYINGRKIPYSNGKYYLYRKLLLDIIEDAAIDFWGSREYPGTLTKSLEFAKTKHNQYRHYVSKYGPAGADAQFRTAPLRLIAEALTQYGALEEEMEFPEGMSEAKALYEQCKQFVYEARNAIKTSDRCKLANSMFEVLRPLIDELMEKGEKCPEFLPVQPSTHNKFNAKNQNFGSFRKMMLDKYDIKEDMEKLLDSAAKDEYDRKIDRKYSDQLTMSISNLQDSGLGMLHNTIKMEFIQSDIKLFATYREKYTQRVVRLTPKIKLLLKSLLAVVQREQDDTIRDLYAGNRYTDPFRADKKCCSYRKALSDEADLFIYVLVDSSGSMSKVSDFVKDALTMFNEVCRRMNIPITIVSHMANDTDVTIRTLVDANIRSSDNTGIESYTPGGGTRDGVALACAAEYLKFRKEAQKIVIAISDGQPWHTCRLDLKPEHYKLAEKMGVRKVDADEFFSEYSNYSAADIKSIIRNMNVHPIGIALAPTMDMARLLNANLNALYPESFATDIDHLARKLSQVLEKYLYA